jgi:hypothetical protein
MKSNLCMVWVLGAVMAIAAVDTMLDPPAVNPHTVNVASCLREARSSVCKWRLNSERSYASHLQIRWITFTLDYEPNLPNDWIALTGFAADPSPPALHLRSL